VGRPRGVPIRLLRFATAHPSEMLLFLPLRVPVLFPLQLAAADSEQSASSPLDGSYRHVNNQSPPGFPAGTRSGTGGWLLDKWATPRHHRRNLACSSPCSTSIPSRQMRRMRRKGRENARCRHMLPDASTLCRMPPKGACSLRLRCNRQRVIARRLAGRQGKSLSHPHVTEA
jgi:hypothetical protein